MTTTVAFTISKLVPLQDNVVIQVLEVEQQSETASKILLPDDVKSPAPPMGVVIAVGPGKVYPNTAVGQGYYLRTEPKIAVGQKVLFRRNMSTTAVKVGDEVFLLVGEADILAILE